MLGFLTGRLIWALQVRPAGQHPMQGAGMRQRCPAVAGVGCRALSCHVASGDTFGTHATPQCAQSCLWPLQLDHIYSADYFLLLLGLLGASLAACTATNQWPAVKVARRWRFKADETSLLRLQVWGWA